MEPVEAQALLPALAPPLVLPLAQGREVAARRIGRIYPFECKANAAHRGVAAAVGVVTSNSGEEFELRGCYAIPTSGNVLDGQSIITTDMTLSYCSTFCQGSSNYFAVENGDYFLQYPLTNLIHLISDRQRMPMWCSNTCDGNRWYWRV